MMYYMIGVFMLAIGVFIILFGLINDGIGEVPCYITSYLGWIGMFVGMLIIVIALRDKNINENMTTNETSVETETTTETQSVKTSDIKVVILNKYNSAEIISSDKPDKGYFIYEQEKYSYELDNNILFINKDNKTVEYLYVD